MWFRLLADAAEDVADNTNTGGDNTGTYILLAIAVVVLIALFAWSSYSNKKRQKQMQEQINSIAPGYRIKTIGGICGTVVEVDKEENTFVLETGTQEQKSYMKFDMQAVYQANAPTDGSDVYDGNGTDAPETEAIPAAAESTAEEDASNEDAAEDEPAEDEE